MGHVFSVPSFRFAVDVSRAVGSWNRIATMGRKVKDGVAVDFNAATLGQMVDNAARRNELIAVDADHSAAFPETRDSPALAFIDGLAVIFGGRVVKSWRGSPSNAASMPDGLYARIGEVTPRGRDPLVGLVNYRFTSPLFMDQALDEQGRDIGYALLNVAAVNVPFQAGTELQFHAFPNRPTRADRTSTVAKPKAPINTAFAQGTNGRPILVLGAELSRRGKAYAKQHKVPLDVAFMRVLREDPTLAINMTSLDTEASGE